MIYDRKVQNHLIENVLSKVMECVCSEPGVRDVGSQTAEELTSQATLPLHVATMALKHPDFGAEREWRLCATADVVGSAQKFRPTPVGIAPYYEMRPRVKDAKLPVRSVMVGPSPHGFCCRNGSQAAPQEFRARRGKSHHRPFSDTSEVLANAVSPMRVRADSPGLLGKPGNVR